MSRAVDYSRLDELLPRGTKLKDAPPAARGIPYAEWHRLKLAKIFAEYEPPPAEDAPLSKKALATKRDNYGWKSL